jgi:beta-lactam-binding protein with PASTA domain
MVVGQSYLSALHELGPRVQVSTNTRVDNSVPIGTVVAASPEPGETVSETTPQELTIAISQAPPEIVTKTEKERVPYIPSSTTEELKKLEKQVVAPNVIGLSVVSAERVLRSVGLGVSVSGGGNVVTEVPAGGSFLARGESVHLAASAEAVKP